MTKVFFFRALIILVFGALVYSAILFWSKSDEQQKLAPVIDIEEVREDLDKERFEQKNPPISLNNVPQERISLRSGAPPVWSPQSSYSYAIICKSDTDACWGVLSDTGSGISVNIPTFSNFVWVGEEFLVGLPTLLGYGKGLYVVELNRVKYNENGKKVFDLKPGDLNYRSWYFKDINIENGSLYFSVVFPDSEEVTQYRYGLESGILETF